MNDEYRQIIRLYEQYIALLNERIYYLDLYLYITLLGFLAYAALNLFWQWDTNITQSIFRALWGFIATRRRSSTPTSSPAPVVPTAKSSRHTPTQAKKKSGDGS